METTKTIAKIVQVRLSTLGLILTLDTKVPAIIVDGNIACNGESNTIAVGNKYYPSIKERVKITSTLYNAGDEYNGHVFSHDCYMYDIESV